MIMHQQQQQQQLPYCYPLLVASLLIFFFILLKLIARLIISPTSNLLPPGPRQLPVIGNIHNLACGGSLPHRRLRELSNTYGPLMHLKLGQVSTIVASSAEAAKEILKTHDLHFASRPTISAAYIVSYKGKNLSFAPYGDYWRQLRKICILELLSAKRNHSFQSIREEEVHNLIHSIPAATNSSSSSSINLTKMVTVMINNIVTRASIGDKCKYQDLYLATFHETIQLASGFNLADLYPSFSGILGLITGSKRRLERCHRKLDWILSGILQEHKDKLINKTRAPAVGEEDLVDSLLRLQADGGLQFELTNDTIKALIMDVFGAGSETSTTVLIWAMSELMKNPHVMKRAQLEVRERLKGKTKVTELDVSELNYLQLVIKETMRLHTPLPLLLPRESGSSTRSLLGYKIPQKSRVLVNAWAIGRDPQHWGEDAQDFKPERFQGSAIDFKGASYEFLPFGAGRRMCPGMLFGMSNLEFPLAQLLYYFDWELPADERTADLDMDEGFGITAHKKSDLCLRAIPHLVTTLM